MSEHIKLHFLWPRMRHDLRRLVCHQGPMSFAEAIKIPQRIKGSGIEQVHSKVPVRSLDQSEAVPMDIDVQNVQKKLPPRDAQGCPRCFNCNLFGHVAKYWRKPSKRNTFRSNVQNDQIVDDAATLGAMPKNE